MARQHCLLVMCHHLHTAALSLGCTLLPPSVPPCPPPPSLVLSPTTTPPQHFPQFSRTTNLRVCVCLQPTTTNRASDKCLREKRKTINGDDLLWAMQTLGFEDYVEPLQLYLTKYREAEVSTTQGFKRGLSGF